MADDLPPAGFDELPVDEQIDYVERLWDRIADAAGAIPTPEWHRDLVRERAAAHRANPDEGSDWASVRERIEERLRKPSK